MITKMEFRDKFPSLCRLLTEIGFDNGKRLKHNLDLQEEVWNLTELEAMADTLVGEEFSIMAAGEETEQKTLVTAKSLDVLDDWLEDCFQGNLSNLIWE